MHNVTDTDKAVFLSLCSWGQPVQGMHLVSVEPGRDRAIAPRPLALGAWGLDKAMALVLWLLLLVQGKGWQQLALALVLQLLLIAQLLWEFAAMDRVYVLWLLKVRQIVFPIELERTLFPLVVLVQTFLRHCLDSQRNQGQKRRYMPVEQQTAVLHYSQL